MKIKYLNLTDNVDDAVLFEYGPFCCKLGDDLRVQSGGLLGPTMVNKCDVEGVDVTVTHSRFHCSVALNEVVSY